MADIYAASRESVAAERKSRGWSIRTAAERGGISNTYWGKFEKGDINPDPEHPELIRAVSVAFDWPADWATRPPPSDFSRRLAALEQDADEHKRTRGLGIAALEALTEQVEALAAEVHAWRDQRRPRAG